MERILMAGATGYLGGFLLEELQQRGYPIKILVSNASKVRAAGYPDLEIYEAKITDPRSIKGCCDTIDVVISTVGITRQTFHGPLEFFLTVMAMDMIAPEYGSRTLKEFFTGLNR